ncbi:CAP domain-containing protein [Cellulosimicrobium sp. NPDC057127]|uniref:CAP domain-containing protein n=1 Tax=Cellulosimicrobium sp. NPDC057127 TaxID=3346026 RepID=UPI0036369A74
MPSPQTPRHRASGSSAAARPRRREPARHLRTGPARAGAITAGIAAVAVLAPSVGLTAATVTGEVSPEDAGPLGPVVEALPWQDDVADQALAARLGDAASRSGAGRADVARQEGTAPAAGAGTEAGDAEPGDDAPEGAPSSGPTEAPADQEQPITAPVEEPEAAPAPSASPDRSPDGGTTTPPASAAPSAAPAPAPAPVATTAPAPAPSPTEAPTPSGLSAEVAAVIELTNAERAAAGCAPLVVDARLTAAAQLHSEDMLAQGYFDHTSLDGRSPWDRAEAQGYANPSGENIAKGQRTAEEVVRAWMDSPGHRANILSCDSTEIGVGSAGGVWTQLFGRG